MHGRGLAEPEFRSDGERFYVVIWRDWLTAEVIAACDLNSRQRQAIELLRTRGKMTNTECRKAFSVAKRTVSQDLSSLVDMGLIQKTGATGKGVYYRWAKGAPKRHKEHGMAVNRIERRGRGCSVSYVLASERIIIR